MTVLALSSSEAVALRASLNLSLRLRRIKALLFVAPLLLFVCLVFAGPIVILLSRSIAAPEIHSLMPRTAEALAAWDGQGLPQEAAWEALTQDLSAAERAGMVNKLAAILNQDRSGIRSLVMATARQTISLAPPYQTALTRIDQRWADPEIWGTIKRLSEGWTLTHYANALDLRIIGYDHVERQPEGKRLYLLLFARTLKVAVIVTILSLVLAYPVANLLASLPPRWANLLLILVLLPFWTSLLVRTTAWIVLLQKQGVINDALVWAGIIGEAGRIALVYNQTGTLIAMTHVLLPFMILPIYAVMKSVSPVYVRAASSLGASPLTAFWRIYLPQTMPGVGAGVILVFILAVGYYITPSLVGGDSGALISNLIAYHIQKSLNWGLAAALSALLLLGVLCLYWVYDRVVGIDRLRMG